MMHTLWTAARSVLAVLAGIVAMTAVAFAFEIPLRMLTPHPVPPWMWALTLVLTPAAIIYGGSLRSRSKAAAQPADEVMN